MFNHRCVIRYKQYPSEIQTTNNMSKSGADQIFGGGGYNTDTSGDTDDEMKQPNISEINEDEDEEEEQDEGKKFITDEKAVNKMSKLFRKSEISETEAAGHEVRFRGNDIDPDTEKVLKHVLDEFADHVGSEEQDNMRFTLENCTNLGDNPKYKAKDDVPGDKFNWNVMANYVIDGRKYQSEYFAIDDVLFEMYPATRKDGNIANNHGESWLNIYLTEKVAKNFVNKFNKDTTWDIKPTMFRVDKKQHVASCRVALGDIKPDWTLMFEKENDDGKKQIAFHRMPLGKVLGKPKNNGIYHGTGLFSMNYNIVAENTSVEDINTKWSLDDRPKGRISMTLIAVRIIGTSNRYKKITLTKKKGLAGI